MKKIIIPTAFCDFSKNALDFASNTFAKQEVTFYLVHAFGVPNGAAIAVKNLDSILREEAEALMQEFLPNCQKLIKEGHTLEVKIINATLIDAVKEVEIKEKADFIFMGTAGATGLKEMFLGSNASDTAANTDAPLIAVPLHAKFQGLKHVVVATDNKPFTVVSQFERVKALFLSYNSEITTLYVNKSGKENTPEGNVCSEVFSNMPCKSHTIQAPSATTGIRNYVQENTPDLVVLITRKHSFWERLFKRSVSESVLEHITTPILVMHD
ncbi:MAG: universal stress protein [Luteibaculaceae bacterium]